jgi:hypothetical protein
MVGIRGTRRAIIGDKGGRPRRYGKESLKLVAYRDDGEWASRMIARDRASEVSLREQLDELADAAPAPAPTQAAEARPVVYATMGRDLRLRIVRG